MTPRYPNIKVELLEQDGNAFFMIGRTKQALKRNGVSADEIDAFQEEATSGDYDNVITTIMQWVEVE